MHWYKTIVGKEEEVEGRFGHQSCIFEGNNTKNILVLGGRNEKYCNMDLNLLRQNELNELNSFMMSYSRSSILPPSMLFPYLLWRPLEPTTFLFSWMPTSSQSTAIQETLSLSKPECLGCTDAQERPWRLLPPLLVRPSSVLSLHPLPQFGPLASLRLW